MNFVTAEVNLCPHAGHVLAFLAQPWPQDLHFFIGLDWYCLRVSVSFNSRSYEETNTGETTSHFQTDRHFGTGGNQTTGLGRP